VIIPHDQLEPSTLTALIEEFITRDGAVHGQQDDVALDAKAATVLLQLQNGSAVIVFDEEAETCTIVRREDAGP